MRPVGQSIVLFLLAGLAEIGGGYLMWLWWRDGRPLAVGVIGGTVLILYGIIPIVTLPECVKPGESIRCCNRTYRLTFENGAYAAGEVTEGP